MKLRARLFVMILPIITVSFILSGLFASLKTRTTLIQLANRHMTFKAEELRDYFYSEWAVLSKLELENQKEYRLASEQSFYSYAYSLLRSETESILIFTSNRELVKNIGVGIPISNTEEATPEEISPEILKTGWFNGTIYGERRVGVSFPLEPRNWVVLISEREDVFFSEIRKMQQTFLLILCVAILMVSVFLSHFLRFILQPIDRLKRIVNQIYITGNLDGRAEVESFDEIGDLAVTFNHFIKSLKENSDELELKRKAEIEARITAVEREEETLMLLSRVSDLNNEETGAHLKRIGHLSFEMARLLGKNEEQQKLILNSAPLHDIGKIGISESILRKKGKLTAEEYEVMKQHTLFGHDLLKDSKSKYLLEGSVIALTHHERWDGSGYPRGVKGEDIPLVGRIVALVDVFDALTSERSYKKAWTPESALNYIIEQRGLYFDPRIVDLFEKNFPLFLKYTD